jgi:hypothetical protein
MGLIWPTGCCSRPGRGRACWALPKWRGLLRPRSRDASVGGGAPAKRQARRRGGVGGRRQLPGALQSRAQELVGDLEKTPAWRSPRTAAVRRSGRQRRGSGYSPATRTTRSGCRRLSSGAKLRTCRAAQTGESMVRRAVVADVEVMPATRPVEAAEDWRGVSERWRLAGRRRLAALDEAADGVSWRGLAVSRGGRRSTAR